MDIPTVVIDTIQMPEKGKQLLLNVPQPTLTDYRAAGATGLVYRRCGLHLSIDPVFDPPKD
jgi:hypothetical protein